MIYRILKNDFDCFIIIEGNRGLGKSTLALQLAKRVSNKFKRAGKKDYRFNWKSSIVYTKKETKKFLHKWHSIGIADEMINVTFNRDFFDTDQKDIIKMINMNRDHHNLFIACVPQFQTLDSQIKNLCKIRISVLRRGVSMIQTPNRTIYVKDRWDERTNEKIEREWLQKKLKNPQFKKLTTFRGVLKFPPLSKKDEEKYQKVKDEKRNLIAKEEMEINEEKEQSPYEKIIEMLKNGKVKNGAQLDGFAQANDIKPTTFKLNIRNKLKNEGVESKLSHYYWEKKAKEKESGSI